MHIVILVYSKFFLIYLSTKNLSFNPNDLSIFISMKLRFYSHIHLNNVPDLSIFFLMFRFNIIAHLIHACVALKFYIPNQYPFKYFHLINFVYYY